MKRRDWVRRFLFLGRRVGVAIRIVPVIGARLKYCHGPSVPVKHTGRKARAPWPARQTAARKKKPATPVGMTEFG